MAGTASIRTVMASRAARWTLVGLGLLALGWVAISWPRWQLRAELASGFGARVACSCRYVQGRDLPSCRSDFAGLEGMHLVRFTDDPARRTVEASVPLLARRQAAFRPGFGCLPDKAQ